MTDIWVIYLTQVREGAPIVQNKAGPFTLENALYTRKELGKKYGLKNTWLDLPTAAAPVARHVYKGTSK